MSDSFRNISQFLTKGLKNLGGARDVDSVLDDFVVPKLNTIVAFSVVVAVVMIIVSAYMMITSMGDPEKTSRGQKTLTAAIIGMVIVIVARILIVYVLEKLGLD